MDFKYILYIYTNKHTIYKQRKDSMTSIDHSDCEEYCEDSMQFLAQNYCDTVDKVKEHVKQHREKFTFHFDKFHAHLIVVSDRKKNQFTFVLDKCSGKVYDSTIWIYSSTIGGFIVVVNRAGEVLDMFDTYLLEDVDERIILIQNNLRRNLHDVTANLKMRFDHFFAEICKRLPEDRVSPVILECVKDVKGGGKRCLQSARRKCRRTVRYCNNRVEAFKKYCEAGNVMFRFAIMLSFIFFSYCAVLTHNYATAGEKVPPHLDTQRILCAVIAYEMGSRWRRHGRFMPAGLSAMVSCALFVYLSASVNQLETALGLVTIWAGAVANKPLRKCNSGNQKASVDDTANSASSASQPKQKKVNKKGSSAKAPKDGQTDKDGWYIMEHVSDRSE